MVLMLELLNKDGESTIHVDVDRLLSLASYLIWTKVGKTPLLVSGRELKEGYVRTNWGDITVKDGMMIDRVN